MGLPLVLFLPLVLLAGSGVLFIYRQVSGLWARSAVQNRVVVITDATSGLGKECSRLFHAGGARLVLCGRDWEKLEELCEALRGVADPSKTFPPRLVFLDLSDINCVQDVAKEVSDCYGCVDVLVNNASVKLKGPVQSLSLELDKEIMEANYFGPITLTKALLPGMLSRRTGQIVLVNTVQGRVGLPFRTAYAASKHAVLGFFDCLRAEVEEFDVAVSTVSPAFVRPAGPRPGTRDGPVRKLFFRKPAYGSHPADVAEEVMRVVRGKRPEVLLLDPLPRVALYVRTLLPDLFFAVTGRGVEDRPSAPRDG
ncbi:dehydrogenase/reductase SDR family member 7C [Ornithorhynchus anatinus]|uniref:Dehydrogenase/reductase SDR family member 7C n=1 Tax=Ornithorhynchus anatinus TaxID=9258 RepID=A0A6I8NJ20_ORNAN|nr:dehydrogenase/reductase SDR family member 7C [Ornithorhynchus anatinus]